MTKAARTGLVSMITSVALLAPLLLCAQDSRPSPKKDGGTKQVTFAKAVESFVQAVRADAPPGLKCELEDTTPKKLGWDAAEKTPARTLTVWHPNGAHRALGLLPRRGTYRPRKDAWPQLLAIGPDLVVVAAPEQPVAMTREAIDRAIPLLQKALTPLQAWEKGTPLVGDARPATLRDMKAVVRHPHYLEVDLGPGQELDTKPLLEKGPVVWRRVADGKPPAAPTIVID